MTPNPKESRNDSLNTHRYTRQQAIDDGVLFDLTEWAEATGFTMPVTCTAAVWYRWIMPPEGKVEPGHSKTDRAHHVLRMLFAAVRRQQATADPITFEVTGLNPQRQPETATLQARHEHDGDDEPVMVVMLEHEE
jgi:hypothetical protein